MKYDIWINWCEPEMGDNTPNPPQLLAKDVEGDSFLEAVIRWYSEQENATEGYGPLYIEGIIPKIYGKELREDPYEFFMDFKRVYGEKYVKNNIYYLEALLEWEEREVLHIYPEPDWDKAYLKAQIITEIMKLKEDIKHLKEKKINEME